MSLLLALTAPSGQVEVSWLEITASLVRQLMLNSSGVFEYGPPSVSKQMFLNTSGIVRAGSAAGSGDQDMGLTAGGFTAAV